MQSQVECGAPVRLRLGLRLCKAIVEQHCGEIGLRSTPGGGAIFWFALPVGRTIG
jgi:signal transduction histidine kinase